VLYFAVEVKQPSDAITKCSSEVAHQTESFWPVCGALNSLGDAATEKLCQWEQQLASEVRDSV